MHVVRYLLAACLIACVLARCTAPAVRLYEPDDGRALLMNPAKCIAVVPITVVRQKLFDNTKALPDTQFSDSFFVEAINGLMPYEVSQHFRLCPAAKPDSAGPLIVGRYSELTGEKGDRDTAAAQIRGAAARCGADLVAVPFACSIEHHVNQPKGWRNGQGYYEKPVSYTAETAFHLQIWTNDGRLIFERIGVASTGRPVLYSIFKKEKQGAEAIADFARHFYAPPLVKSLYAAMKNAMVW
jgi:hypothetical protein